MIEDLLESTPTRLEGDRVIFGDVPIRFKLTSYGRDGVDFANCDDNCPPHHTYICTCTESLSDSMRIAKWVIRQRYPLYESLNTNEITIDDAGDYTRSLIKKKEDVLRYDLKRTEEKLRSIRGALSGIE